jgi:NTE family protein
METEQKTGLILTGGGARAAYQAGVLDAIGNILADTGRPHGRSPFDVICGTSAGALNATALACRADNFEEGVHKLLQVWQDIKAEQVYRADLVGIMRSGARWMSLFAFGWLFRKWQAAPPNSLLDNTPLCGLLHRILDLPRLDRALASGHLQALAVTASSYTMGHHVTFYQAATEVVPWVRTHRLALADQIGVEHLLASSAIPFIFPAVPLYLDGRLEYCGDGSMRQLSPISPAVHLGADRILVVGAGRANEAPPGPPSTHYPSLAQIAGHALSSIFFDSLSADVERANRINQTLSMMSARERARMTLRPLKLLVIAPSERLDEIAARHARALPRPVRTMLGAVGAMESRGASLASYLLFEHSFTRELVDLGRRDTYARRHEVQAFFA